ncbi:MAG: hypothetical protein H8D67_30850 [Deltaproteobacteria bacterium]|nr:hypothetical protein [Deltaproteobacteria bacterium]
MKNVKDAAARDIFEIYCECGESIFDAAKRTGYLAPLYRVGLVAHACPREGERLIAKVKAGRYALGLPVFIREIEGQENRMEELELQ